MSSNLCLLVGYVIILEAGVNSNSGSEPSGVTLTIINKPWEPQHSSGKWYSEIKHKNDSCWRIPEKNKMKKIEKKDDQRANCIILKNKSMIIIQINQEIYFGELLKYHKLSEFNQNYIFYE
jgi:hypothetical protein